MSGVGAVSQTPAVPARRARRLADALATRETHGRWPWMAAGAALPSSVAVLAAREPVRDDLRSLLWASLPALFWHQTEEWVFPGGFLPWFNRDVMGSESDEFPITRRLGAVINTGLGWGVGLAGALLARRAPWLGVAFLTTNVPNAALHVSEAVRQRAYNPGLATSITLLAPVGAAGLVRVARSRRVSGRDMALGIGLGVGVSLGTFLAMRRRMQSAHGRPG